MSIMYTEEKTYEVHEVDAATGATIPHNVRWLGRQQVGKAHWETRSITMAILSKLPDTS